MTGGIPGRLAWSAGNWDTTTDVSYCLQTKFIHDKLTQNDHLFFLLGDVLSWRYAYFGQGTGMPILMDNIRCLGNESRLVDCPFSNPFFDFHSEDAGVRCFSNNTSMPISTLSISSDYSVLSSL